MLREFRYEDIDHKALASALAAEGQVLVLLDQKRSALLDRLMRGAQAVHAEPATDKIAFAGKAGKSLLLMLRLAVFHNRLLHIFGFYETEKPSYVVKPRSANETAFEFKRRVSASKP